MRFNRSHADPAIPFRRHPLGANCRRPSRGTGAHGHRDLDRLVQSPQNRHQPIDGEPAEVGPANTGKIRRRDASQIGRGPNGEPAVIQHTDNPGRQEGPQLLAIRVGVAEITEHVAAAMDQLQIIHRFSAPILIGADGLAATNLGSLYRAYADGPGPPDHDG